MRITYPHPEEGVVSRLVAGEAVLVRLPEGEMTVLNPAGSLVWALATGERPEDAIAEALGQAYGLPEAPDLSEFFSALVQHGLLVRPTTPLHHTGSDIPTPAAGEYEPPAILASEPLEVLAAVCGSNYGGIYANCQLLGSCIHPYGSS